MSKDSKRYTEMNLTTELVHVSSDFSGSRGYLSAGNKKHDRPAACQGRTISSPRWIDDPSSTTCRSVATYLYRGCRLTSFPEERSSSSSAVNVAFTFRFLRGSLTFPKRDGNGRVQAQTFRASRASSDRRRDLNYEIAIIRVGTEFFFVATIRE